MYIAIKKNPNLEHPWLKWRVVLMSASSAIQLKGTQLYCDLQDARKFASYLAKELNIKAVLKV